MAIRSLLMLPCILAASIAADITAKPAYAATVNKDAVAVIIGNSAYTHGDIPAVNYAHRDADAMLRFVRDVMGVREDNIIVLKDATQAQMESALGRPGNPRGKAYQYVRPGESDLLVFYSGHGLPGPNDGKRYLLPSDADLATVEINGYPLSALYDNLTHTDARSVTVFLDACFTGGSHGGALLKKASGVRIIPQVEEETSQTPVPLTVVTAASSNQLASWDEDAGHGLFTEYLLQALYGEADTSEYGKEDGKVTLSEVKNYLDREMRYRARRVYNREQTPFISGAPQTVLASAEAGIFPKRPALTSDEPITSPELETITISLDPMDMMMETTSNSNVRAGPGTDYEKLITLPRYAQVHVTGKVADEPWFLISQNGERLGYIHASLLQVPTTELDSQTVDELHQRIDELEREVEREKTKTPSVYRTPSQNGMPDRELALFDNMNEMARILSEQTQIQRVDVPVQCANRFRTNCSVEGVSALVYKDIRPRPRLCRLQTTVSFAHDKLIQANGKRKGIYAKDKTYKVSLKTAQPLTRKTYRVRSEIAGEVNRVTYYKYGPLHFSSKADRNQFARLARDVTSYCQERAAPPVMRQPPQNPPQRPPQRTPQRPAPREPDFNKILRGIHDIMRQTRNH